MNKTYRLIDKAGYLANHDSNQTLFDLHFSDDGIVSVSGGREACMGRISDDVVIDADEWGFFEDVTTFTEVGGKSYNTEDLLDLIENSALVAK